MLPEGWVLSMRNLPGQHALELEITSPRSSMTRVVAEILLTEAMRRDVLDFEVGDMIECIREHEVRRWE